MIEDLERKFLVFFIVGSFVEKLVILVHEWRSNDYVFSHLSQSIQEIGFIMILFKIKS